MTKVDLIHLPEIYQLTPNEESIKLINTIRFILSQPIILVDYDDTYRSNILRIGLLCSTCKIYIYVIISHSYKYTHIREYIDPVEKIPEVVVNIYDNKLFEFIKNSSDQTNIILPFI